MTDFASLLQPDRGQSARTIHLVDKAGYEDWLKRQPPERRALLEAMRLDGKSEGQFAIVPFGRDDFEVVVTVRSTQSLTPWCLARAGGSLPGGTYRLADGQPGLAAIGWLLAQHRFDRYKTSPQPDSRAAVLLSSKAALIERYVNLATATGQVRDRVDTPASDLGPQQLEVALLALAEEFGATATVTKGDALDQGYPMIAAVGQGAARDRQPRLLELVWGREDAPRVAIVGKGVCFDSGGLDIKPASGMRLMKKDMGGAAHALSLAWLVMRERLPVRFHLLIPAVENSVSANAFRPGDVLTSRKGLTVEVDNTDAEGRLVLGDALTRAVEEKPEVILDFATLTGAARVALGPDLPAMFANDDVLAASLEAAARDVHDPLWRMPLWEGYDEMLKSDLADLANAADSPMAGAVTAALFLRRFVPTDIPWAHFDTFAWRPVPRPGRPKGGEALGLRAAFAMLEARYKA